MQLVEEICPWKNVTIRSVKELLESVDNHAIMDFMQKNILVKNCSVCYVSFVSAL